MMSRSKRKLPLQQDCTDAVGATRSGYVYSTKDTERPVSPSRMNRDILWHVLYDSDIELIRDITLPATILAEETNSSGTSEIINYVKLCKNMNVMRTMFFIILNIDETLRADVCSPTFCRSVWTVHGRPTPLCPYKASRFFQDLEETCIHAWMRNERCTTTNMIENLRLLYMCS